MTDHATAQPVAAAHLQVGLDADGTGLLHVRHLLADPGAAADRPEELLASWSTHWAAHRTATVREVRIVFACPVTRGRRPIPAALRREDAVADRCKRRIEVRAALALPALASMVGTRPEPVADEPYAVLPVRREDQTALAHLLRARCATADAEDYPPAGSGPVQGWMFLADGYLAAVFTIGDSTAAPRAGAGARPHRERVLFLDRLWVFSPDCDLELLVHLTRWAASRAAEGGYAVVGLRLTQRELPSRLEDLGWRTARVSALGSVSGGLVWLMELRVPGPVRDTTGGGR
ncbi:hypothetical protein [Streptomyces sp. NPDC048606]|uniref:hypothetical protein n=1 Tax=Streptomyces sp. NPDC048606 TaxID=3154726 RepID=UPI003429E3C2